MIKLLKTIAAGRAVIAIALCCTVTLAVLTACTSDNNDNPATGLDGKIVGNWFSKVTGKTCALWNYGDTWQNTVFNDDGTGYTRIYYTLNDKAVGCEKIDICPLSRREQQRAASGSLHAERMSDAPCVLHSRLQIEADRDPTEQLQRGLREVRLPQADGLG